MFPKETIKKKIKSSRLVENEIKYIEYQKLYANKIDFDKLNDIFSSWLNQNMKYIPSAKDLPDYAVHKKNVYPIYTYDNIKYFSTVEYFNSPDGNKNIWNLRISLVNDGFLYTRENEIYKHSDRYISRHRYDGWVELKVKCYAQNFKAITDFLNQWSPLEGGKKGRMKIYYHDVEERIDFRMFYSYDEFNEYSLTISFEPGSPEQDFEDSWVDIPD